MVDLYESKYRKKNKTNVFYSNWKFYYIVNARKFILRLRFLTALKDFSILFSILWIITFDEKQLNIILHLIDAGGHNISILCHV